ncbi:MAG: BACON domain-containing carbohydrate-binding protein, partial [Blastocatellia bacterium]|nr:BACON domain-containing carbohydrate-binding protein [Blastocatellia bacterium]
MVNWTGKKRIIAIGLMLFALEFAGLSAFSGWRNREAIAGREAQCTYTIFPGSRGFFAGGGSARVDVNAGVGCAWTATSNAAWITIDAGASGSGDGAVDYSVAANTGPERTGTITVAGITFTVTQSNGCVYGTSASSQTFSAAGGAHSVTVTAGAGCPWTATSSDAWLTITGGGSGVGNGEVLFSVSPNAGPERFGRMSIAGRLFVARQETDCSFALSSEEQNFSAAGGTGTVNVSTTGNCAWTGATVVNTPPELPRAYVDTTPVPSSGQRIEVPAGGDFQAALDQAQPGDEITLQAGASYIGNFILPVKTGSGWITIRTSAPDSSLPGADMRITPAYANVLPRILTPNVEPAIEARDGAHHYRFVGVEIAAAETAAFVYNLVLLGEKETTLAQVPHDLIFDRVYIHGAPAFTLRRGIALNSASTAIINSYIADCHEVGVDSQAIGGWNGPGPFKIVNNYLEGAGENFILGGSDPVIPNLVPSDVEFRRNHCYKPLSWRIDDPSYAGTPWGVKNLFELKNAQRLLIDGNLFEHNWTMAQNGIAILFTVRNQDGTAPWSVVQDVTFTNNIVRQVAGGINLLGLDNNNPSLATRRIRIANNLLAEVDGQKWNGAGIAFQFVASPGDLTIENNTILHSGNIIAAGDTPTEPLIFRNNLFPHNEFGIKGDERDSGNATIRTYLPGALVRRNVMAAGPAASYPADNFFPAALADVMFQDFAGGNYRLAMTSPYHNAGTNGKDVGADFDLLDAAQNGSVPPVAAVSNAPWISITSGASGMGAGAVGYSVEPNTGPRRMGTMVIAGITFTVTQDSGCSVILGSSSQSFPSSGGTGAVGVIASAICDWTAKSNASWLSITSGGSGVGSGTVAFSVGANTGAARTGTLTIAGQSFTVTQAGDLVGLQFYSLASPIRLLDTRAGFAGCDAPGAQIPGGTARTQTIAGRTCSGLSIPANARAVTGNITTVQSGGGFLTLYPSDVTRPLVANSNYGANEILNNVFTVGLGGGDGAFNIYVTTNTDVVVDVTGYYAPPGAGGLYFHPLPRPVRLLETRVGPPTGCYRPGMPLAGATETVQQATGDCDGVTIPANARAIVG